MGWRIGFDGGDLVRGLGGRGCRRRFAPRQNSLSQKNPHKRTLVKTVSHKRALTRKTSQKNPHKKDLVKTVSHEKDLTKEPSQKNPHKRTLTKEPSRERPHKRTPKINNFQKGSQKQILDSVYRHEFLIGTTNQPRTFQEIHNG